MGQRNKSQLVKVYVCGGLILTTGALLFYLAVEYSQLAVFSKRETVGTTYDLIRTSENTQVQFSMSNMSTGTVRTLKRESAEALWSSRRASKKELEPEKGARLGLDYMYLLLGKSFEDVNIKMTYYPSLSEEDVKDAELHSEWEFHDRWGGSFEEGEMKYDFVIDSVTGRLMNLYCSLKSEDSGDMSAKGIFVGESRAFELQEQMMHRVYDMLRGYPFYVEGELFVVGDPFQNGAMFRVNGPLFAEYSAHNDSKEHPFNCVVYFDLNGKVMGFKADLGYE